MNEGMLRNKTLVLLVLLIASVQMHGWLTGSAFANKQTEEIKANAFVLIDDKGEKRGGMYVVKGSPVMEILGRDKRAMHMFIGDEGGPTIALVDKQKVVRTMISMSENGDCWLQINHANGRQAIGLLASKTSNLAGISANSPMGKSQAVLTAENDASLVGIIDEEGNNRGSLMYTDKIGANLLLFDKSAIAQIKATVTDSKDNKIIIKNTHRNETLIAGVGEYGAQLRMNNLSFPDERGAGIGLVGEAPWMALKGANGKQVISNLAAESNNLFRAFDDGELLWQLPSPSK